MPNKPLKDLYEEFNPKLNIANTYEEFESIMNDPKNRESFFNDFNSELNLAKDYKEFDSILGYPEKKKFKVEDFNKKYGTSYSEQEFGVKVSSPSPSKSQSTTTTTTSPKTTQSREANLELKIQDLSNRKQELGSFEPKIAELNAAMQPYNELAKQNGGTLPPEEFAQYQQLYNESRKLSSEYKLAYNGYQQAFNEYKGEIGKFNASIEAGKKETEVQKAKRLGEEKAKVEKLGKTNPLGRIKLYTQTIDNINQKIPFLVEEYNKAEQAGDEAAMQKIELEIDKQQANIDYMTKAIEGQKKLGAMQVEDSIVNSFNVGLYRVIGKGMQAKKDLDEQLVTLINDVTGVDQKFTDTYFKHIYKYRSPLSDKFAEAGKYIQKKAEEKGELKNLNRKYGASAWNAMQNGDVPTAIEYAFKDFIGFLPASLTYQNKATAAISSIGIIGDELEAAKERGETPDSKTVLAGGIKAGLEIATERWLGAGKATKQLIDRLGRDGAEQVVREVYEGVAKKSLGRKIGENIGEEVIGENINLLGSNAVDIFINKTKKPDQLFEGIGDNTLVSIFGSGVQSTATTTVSHYIYRSKLKEAELAKTKAQSLQEQALEAESPVVAEAIEKEAEKLNDWADEVIDWNNEIGANASPEVVAQLEETNAQIDELEAALPEATPEIAEAITAQIEELSITAQELAKTAEEETILALEGLKSTINTQEDAIQEQTTDEGLLRQEGPELGLQEVEQGNVQPESVTQEGKAKEEVVSSSEPSKADKSYKEAQGVNTIVSKENPNASVLIQPKGEDLILTAVYVGKENRGKGIGTKVLESVKKQADKLGKKVILDATNELDSETDLERLGKFYEKNGFAKVGDNKYEYDPKNEDSSGDISTRNDNSGTKEQDISGVNDKGKSDKKPTTSAEEVAKEQPKEEPKSVVSKEEVPAKEQEVEVKEQQNSMLKDVESTTKALEGKKQDIWKVRKTIDGTIKGMADQVIKRLGGKITHESPSGSIYIELQNGETIRISDHQVQTYTPQSIKHLGSNIGLRGSKVDFNYEIGTLTIDELEEEVRKDSENPEGFLVQKSSEENISEAYHKAKKDGSNPELVKAVEELLTQKPILSETTASENKKVEPNKKSNEKTNDEGDVRKEDVTKDEGQAREVGKDDAKGQVKEVLVEAGVAEKVTPAKADEEEINDFAKNANFKKAKSGYLYFNPDAETQIRIVKNGTKYNVSIHEIDEDGITYKTEPITKLTGFDGFSMGDAKIQAGILYYNQIRKDVSDSPTFIEKSTPEEIVEAENVEPKKQVRKKVAAMAKDSGKTISEWKKEALALVDKAINTIIENHTEDKGIRDKFAKGEIDFSYAIDESASQVLIDAGIEVNEKGQIVIPTPNGALFVKPSTLFSVRKEISKLSDSNVVSNDNTKIKGAAPKKVDLQVASYEMYEPESVQDAKDELDISNEVLANAKKSGNKKLIELAQVQVYFYKDWYENFDAKMESYAEAMARYEASEKARERLEAIKADKNLAKLYSSSESVFKEAGIYSLEDLYDLLQELGIEKTPEKVTDEIMAYLFAKAAFESRKPTYLTYQTTLKDRVRPIPKLTAKSSWKRQSEARQIERTNEELNNLMSLADKYSKEATKIFKEISPAKEEDRFINFMDSLKIRAKGKALGVLPPFVIPVALWNTAMDTIILSIKAGKKIHQAVSEGYELVKNYVSEKDFKDYLVEAGISKDNINAPAKEEVKTEGKIAKSGFQERSIEDAKDEVVKKIARENEVYYEVMNQKAEYENALKDFGTLEGVIENYSDLNLSGAKDVTLNEAARLQVKRQVAMQTLSVEIATELAKGNNPTKLNDKVNEIQNALAKDFTKGGQIGAMAIWKFMTPAGIVYQVKEKIKEQNAKKEEMLSDDAKQEIAELNDKVAKLQVKLDEEIAKTAERKAEKAASKTSKGLTEAEKKRKEELKMSLRKKMFGQLNDITNIPKILLDKETIEYAKLIIKEGALDFNSFSKEMIKDFGKLVKPILPKLYTKATGESLLDAESQKQMEEFMQKEFTKAYGTSKIPVKRKVKADLNKIVEGVESGVLNDNFYKQLFLEKFGMKADLTLEETAELHRLAEAVSSLPATSRLYNIAVMNMAQFINNKYPRTFWSDLADTWVALNYAQMLAGVSTHILNIISTGSGIANSPFRNAINISKWARSIRMGIKDGSLQSAWVYNPLYEAIYVPSAWAKGVKVGSDIAMSTMMEGAMTDKYVEGLVNMKGKVQVSNLEQNRYGEGKRFRPIRINGVDVNPYNLLKYVGRSLASEDALMFQTAYEAELAGLALSIYREKGLRGKALAQAVTDAYMLARVDSGKIEEQVANEVAILEKTGIKVSERNKRIRASELAVNEVLRTLEASQDQKENIKNLAASATFTDVRNGVISRIARLIASATNSSRAAQVGLKPFVPFTQVVANVTEWMLDSTPVYGLMRANNLGVTGLVNRAMKATGHEGIATAQLGEYKSQAYYEQMARAWQGTIAMAALISIFGHSGDEDEDYENSYLQLTGGYEEETRRNKSGRTKVTPKYTIRIGDKMFTYLNIPPLAIPLALIGNYNDYMNLRRYGKEELAERKGLAFAASVASTTTLIKDMSFIQGTQELLSTLYEVVTTEENKVSKAAKGVLDKYLGFATRPLPQNNNLILQIEKFFDPTSYSRKEISDITKYSLGIQHIVGNPSVDILGDAVKSYPAETTIPYTHWFNISKADDDWKFMARYNAIQGKLKNAPTKIFNQKTDKYEERTMDAKEFYDYTVLAGKKFREKVQNYRKNVNADTRVREKEEIGGKEVNGVDYDLNKLHWEAKEEAKAKLFLVKNISDKELNVLREMDNASSLATKQKSEENKKKVIEVQESLNITDQEKTLDISVKEVPKNADELVMDYIKELAPDDKSKQSEISQRLIDLNIITKERRKKIAEAMEFNY